MNLRSYEGKSFFDLFGAENCKGCLLKLLSFQLFIEDLGIIGGKAKGLVKR
jgi:hypothetical protein